MKRWLCLFALTVTLQTYPIPGPGYPLPDGGKWEEDETPACRAGVCWNEAQKRMVAFICYDEMRGLLRVGMASCASTIARRHSRPQIWGDSLDYILRFDQFAVPSAKTRPWERGQTPSAAALQAIEYFLSGARGPGCWGYDSFQGSPPEQARAWLSVAPERRCIVVRPPQAALFFNWRDG